MVEQKNSHINFFLYEIGNKRHNKSCATPIQLNIHIYIYFFISVHICFVIGIAISLLLFYVNLKREFYLSIKRIKYLKNSNYPNLIIKVKGEYQLH